MFELVNCRDRELPQLVVPERNHRIDAQCAASGNEAGGRRQSEDKAEKASERQWIVERYAVQEIHGSRKNKSGV